MDNQEIQNEEIEINLAELFQVLKESFTYHYYFNTNLCDFSGSFYYFLC